MRAIDDWGLRIAFFQLVYLQDFFQPGNLGVKGMLYGLSAPQP